MRYILFFCLPLAACASTPPPSTPPPGTPPPRTQPRVGIRDVSVGYMHHCTLEHSGRVVCKGDSSLDQCRVPAKLRFKAVSAGLYHSCGLLESGEVRCWGSDRGPYEGNATPNLPGPLSGLRLETVAAGDAVTCGLTPKSTVVCWGNKQWQKEGTYVQLVVGFDHACALDSKGQVSCFGEENQRDDSYPCEEMEDVPKGLCKPGERIPRSWTPAPAGLTARAVAAGQGHTCALTPAGKVRCWGADGWGDGNSVWAGQTRVPPGLPPAVQISAGGGHSCARHADGKVTCWGDRKSPQGRFTKIDSGADKACGLLRSGTLKCW